MLQRILKLSVSSGGLKVERRPIWACHPRSTRDTKTTGEGGKQVIRLTPRNCWCRGEGDCGRGNFLHMCHCKELKRADWHTYWRWHASSYSWTGTPTETWLCTLTSNFSSLSAEWQSAGAYILAPICQQRKNLTYTLFLLLQHRQLISCQG